MDGTLGTQAKCDQCSKLLPVIKASKSASAPPPRPPWKQKQQTRSRSTGTRSQGTGSRRSPAPADLTESDSESTAPPAAPSAPDADMSEPDPDKEITRLQKLQSALILPEDQDIHQTLQLKIDEVRRLRIAAKPLDEQIRSLETVIKTKKDKLQAAQAQIDKLQALAARINVKLGKLEPDLQKLKQQKVAEMMPQALAQSAEAQALVAQNAQLTAAHAISAAQNTQLSESMQNMAQQFAQLQSIMQGLPPILAAVQQKIAKTNL